jgi:hypothetical protein
MNFGFSIKNGKGKQVAKKQTLTQFGPSGSSACINGWPDFAERSTLLDSLVDGTLVVEVHMKSLTTSKTTLTQFIPENPFCTNMLQLFNDEDSADVVFAVGELQSKNNASKVAKIEPVKFYAHCLILRACSTILAELCNSKGDPTTPIKITDVSPDIFRHLLYYIYGGKISDVDMKSHAKEIIDAANRYGVATLKLEAEACLMEGTTFSLENVKEHLLYAESKNCALLKEVDDVPSTLMRDLFVAFAREPNRPGSTANGENRFNTMRISELRRMVHERGLDVDGSREMLIAALKQTP